MDRSVITAAGAPAAIGPYSHAIVAGDTLYVSGQIGIDPATGILADTLEEQTERALGNLANILAANGMTLANVVKVTAFIDDMDKFGVINGIYGRVFEQNQPRKDCALENYFTLAEGVKPIGFPARSCVQVAALPKGAQVEIEAVAVR